MKGLILAVIVAIAGTMAFLVMRGECPGGEVFASEASCLASGRAPAVACRDGFTEALRAAREDQSPFSTQDDCLRQFPRCMPHGRVVGGHVPVPRGACLASGKPGRPVYERIGAARSAS